jgi:predicted transcriptional regulator
MAKGHRGPPTGARLMKVHLEIIERSLRGERPIDIARAINRSREYVDSAISNLRRHGLIPPSKRVWKLARKAPPS